MPLLIILVFVFIFGLIIGSFLNCLIWRLHEEISLTPFSAKGSDRWKRSYCPKCKEPIAWYDNIPVLSFVLLGAKCRHCHAPISWQYPIVELATGILFVMAFTHNIEFRILNFESIFNYSIINNSIKIQNLKFIIQLLRDWLIISAMIVVFIYDLRWYLILDSVTLPACLAVLILNLLLGFSLWELLISGIIGGSFFLIQLVVSSGRWVGGGDIRLGLLMGLALGWPGVIVAMIISYFLGSIVGVGLILTGKKRWSSQVPLGVFLAIGSIITLFWQARILDWYWNLL